MKKPERKMTFLEFILTVVLSLIASLITNIIILKLKGRL